MFIMRLFLKNNEIEERRFSSQSELASFLKIADLTDVDLITITLEDSNPRMLRILGEVELDD